MPTVQLTREVRAWITRYAAGATLGASKQRNEAEADMTHQQRIDLAREGKHSVIANNTPEARPGNRDTDTEDRESHPRL